MPLTLAPDWHRPPPPPPFTCSKRLGAHIKPLSVAEWHQRPDTLIKQHIVDGEAAATQRRSSAAMIGKSVGPKPARCVKEPAWGQQAPAWAAENALQLGDTVVRPQPTAPAFSTGQEHFQTDAELLEHQQRAARQQQYQV